MAYSYKYQQVSPSQTAVWHIHMHLGRFLLPVVIWLLHTNFMQLLAHEKLSTEAKKLGSQIGDDAVIVVSGIYDHVHQVLISLKILFKIVQQHELFTYPLCSEDQTVYVNWAHLFLSDTAYRLREFVNESGHLITTDCTLKNVPEISFGEESYLFADTK